MNRIKVIVMCGDKCINEHSDGGSHYEWNNPFGDFIPMVGDILELGGRYYDKDDDENSEGKRYKVVKRSFKAYESWNYRYVKQECILEVEEM